jgi:hypothetical protein
MEDPVMDPKVLTYDICRHYTNDLEGVDSALKNIVLGYNRARCLAELTSCSRHFDQAKHSIDDWRFLRQVEAFFKKNSAFSDSKSCADAAQASFFEAEKACAITNLRLDFFYSKRDLLDPDLRSWIVKMERYIHNVLGDFQKFQDDLPNLVRVTSGATAHASRKDSLPQLKLKTKLHATRGAHSYLKALYRYFGFEPPVLVECHSNRMERVPKNWKTDRTIACEPEGDLPLQLAFDTYAKRRLRRFGIDLSQQFLNQLLARHASVYDDFVTVDKKAASDTVAYNAVAWLFPWQWYCYLDRLRSPYYRGCFGKGKYHKFSSMGNGSTFAIETLIFAAACHAVGSRHFCVYGDDVIIESEYYDDYLRLTRFFGFTINTEKTFVQGPFRESCGLDVFRGVDVTPLYLRHIDGRKAILCHLVNTVAQLAIPEGTLATYLRRFVAEHKLPLVPFQDSSVSGVWIDPSTAHDQKILRSKRWIWRYKAYVPKVHYRRFRFLRGYYLWFLRRRLQVSYAQPWHIVLNQTHQKITLREGLNPPGTRLLVSEPETQSETSSVPIFDHYFVRRWVCWHTPANAMPVHLYWWTEFLVTRKNTGAKA